MLHNFGVIRGTKFCWRRFGRWQGFSTFLIGRKTFFCALEKESCFFFGQKLSLSEATETIDRYRRWSIPKRRSPIRSTEIWWIGIGSKSIWPKKGKGGGCGRWQVAAVSGGRYRHQKVQIQLRRDLKKTFICSQTSYNGPARFLKCYKR